jgi:hypothetical protein
MFTHREAQILGLFFSDTKNANASCGDDCERCAKVTLLCCDDAEMLASGRGPFFIRWFTGDFRGIPLVIRVFVFALCVAAVPIMVVLILNSANDHTSSSSLTSSKFSYSKGLCDVARNEIIEDRINFHSRGSSRKPLLTYVFIAGIEGSGHHAFLNLLSSSPTTPNYTSPILNLTETSKFNSASRDFWVNTDPRKYTMLRENMLSTLSTINNKVMTEGKPKFIVGPVNVENEPLSFPFGPLRDAVTRPTLRDVREVCMKGKVRLITLVLYRDPFNAVFSRIHSQAQELNYHELTQAKIVEDNLQNLAMEIMSMRCGTVYVVKYERLLSDPVGISNQISKFTGIELKHLHQSKISPPKTKMTLSESAQKGIKDHLGYKDDEAELPLESIRSRGWYPIVAPELDISQAYNRKQTADAVAHGFCCRPV